MGLGRLDDAAPIVEAAHESRRRVLGEDHPDTLLALNSLGFLHRARGQLEPAEACYRRALDGMRRVLGSEHPSTLLLLQNTGYVLQTRGDLEGAEELLGEALAGKRRVLGDEHPETLSAINNMGGLLRRSGRLEEAEPFYREAYDGRRRVLGEDHPDTLGSMSNMGVLLRALGRRDEAIETMRAAAEGLGSAIGEGHPRTLAAVANLGTTLAEVGRLEEGLVHLHRALAGRRQALGDAHPYTRTTAGLVAQVVGKALEDDTDGAMAARRTAELGGSHGVWEAPDKSRWHIMNGGELPASEYPELMAYGTDAWPYSGAGAGRIKLPDFRGMFLRGVGGSGEHSSGPLGEQQSDLVRKHMHKIGGRGVDVGSGSQVRLHVFHTPNESYPLETDSKDYSDSNLGEETRPVNYAVHWVMRVK